MPVVQFDWDELEDNVDEEFDDIGDSIAEYTTEPDLHGNVISQLRGSITGTFHHDGLGSTIAISDDAGVTTDTFAYSAFGETTERTGTTEIPYQFIGQKGYYFDTELDILYIRARSYSPPIIRWLSVDPIGTIAGDRNLYRYALNCPVRFIDPTGLSVIIVTLPAYDCSPYILSPENYPPQQSAYIPDPPCNSRESWSEGMCCPGAPEKGCRCADTKIGASRVNMFEPTLVEELVAEFFDSYRPTGLAADCKIRLGISECRVMLPTGRESTEFSWTIRNPVRGAGPNDIYICMQKGSTYCDFRSLVFHELAHAVQLCTGSTAPLATREMEAYKLSCAESVRQTCYFSREFATSLLEASPGCPRRYTEGEIAEQVALRAANCVTTGVAASTRAAAMPENAPVRLIDRVTLTGFRPVFP